jgi:cell division topological specificity factor
VFDFFRALFKPAPPSGATAKERLRLVLLSDHLSLAPDVIEALKKDLLAVISRYVEIDPDHADVTFEHREHEVAMLASIPITGVRERRIESEPEPAAPFPGPPAQVPVAPIAEALPDVGAEPALGAEPAVGAEPEPARAQQNAAATHPEPARPANGAAPRRRRRKKSAAGSGLAPGLSAAASEQAPQQAQA